MLCSFKEEYIASIAAHQKTSDIAVFLEPSLDSGYPDLVIAVYANDFLHRWNEQRFNVDDRSLKVLACLMDNGAQTVNALSEYSGFSEKQLIRSLEKLHDAGLAKMISGKKWRTENRSQFFGIKKLIAIEAKIDDSAQAIRQAFCNRRFASESYVLLASKAPAESTVDRCKELGIGLFSGKSHRRILKAKNTAVSTNYITLKFNEWIGRSLAKEVDHDLR